MIYFNDKFVSDREAVVSVFDRGFLYGDSLFETIRFYDRRPFLWEEHVARWADGCEAMRLSPPLSAGEMLHVAREAIARSGIQNGFLRLTLSRGVGRRGYSPRGADHPTFCISVHPLPPKRSKPFRVIMASAPVFSGDSLAAYKHGSKLAQVFARMEADEAGADEALLANEKGEVLEASAANLFWVEQGSLCTPPLNRGILPGTTREFVIKLAREMGLRVKEKNIRAAALFRAEGAFLTSAGLEIQSIGYLDGGKLRHDPIIARLKRRFSASL